MLICNSAVELYALGRLMCLLFPCSQVLQFCVENDLVSAKDSDNAF